MGSDLELLQSHFSQRLKNLNQSRHPTSSIVVVGGWSVTGPTEQVESLEEEQLSNSFKLQSGPLCYHGCVSKMEYIYVFGGYDRSTYQNKLWCINTKTHHVTEKTSMEEKRCYVAGAMLDNHIYAAGGYNGHIRLKSAERYDISVDRWEEIASMFYVRSDSSATVMNGHLYVVGGFTGDNCLTQGEYYSPETNQWSMITHMLTPRSGLGLTSSFNTLYAVGGFDGQSRLCSAEKWSHENPRWEHTATMDRARSNFTLQNLSWWSYDSGRLIPVLFYKGFIVVIGGYEGRNPINNVEKYDIEKNIWITLPSMRCPRSAVASCVLEPLGGTLETFLRINQEYGNNREVAQEKNENEEEMDID